MDKAQIRIEYRIKRKLLASTPTLAESMAEHFLAEIDIKSWHLVASYLPCDGEIDPREVVRALKSKGCVILIPIPNTTSGLLDFFMPRNDGSLIMSHPVAPDAFIVPLIAFDKNCNRLGFGKGWYDRTLAHALPNTPMVGLAFEEQRHPSLPTEQHDVPLTAVATDKRIYLAEDKGL